MAHLTLLKLLVMGRNILSYQIFESYRDLSQNRFRYDMQFVKGTGLIKIHNLRIQKHKFKSVNLN